MRSVACTSSASFTRCRVMTSLFITMCKPRLKWRQTTRTESGLAARAWATWLHLYNQTWISHVVEKICHPWSTLSFDFHPELSIKIIQRMNLITELRALSRPLSFYLYQRRCFQGEHLDLRRPSMKWNAVSSLLCLLSKRSEGIFMACTVECLSQIPTIWSEI